MPKLSQKPKKKRKTSNTKTLSWHIRKTQEKFNALIREKGFCERCGVERNILNCSHIYPVGTYPNLRFNILNVLAMDGQCHMFFWHENPLDAWEWFKEKYPARYEYLQRAKNIYHKYTIDELKQIQEWIANKNLRKLTIPLEIPS